MMQTGRVSGRGEFLKTSESQEEKKISFQFFDGEEVSGNLVVKASHPLVDGSRTIENIERDFDDEEEDTTSSKVPIMGGLIQSDFELAKSCLDGTLKTPTLTQLATCYEIADYLGNSKLVQMLDRKFGGQVGSFHLTGIWNEIQRTPNAKIKHRLFSFLLKKASGCSQVNPFFEEKDLSTFLDFCFQHFDWLDALYQSNNEVTQARTRYLRLRVAMEGFVKLSPLLVKRFQENQQSEFKNFLKIILEKGCASKKKLKKLEQELSKKVITQTTCDATCDRFQESINQIAIRTFMDSFFHPQITDQFRKSYQSKFLPVSVAEFFSKRKIIFCHSKYIQVKDQLETALNHLQGVIPNDVRKKVLTDAAKPMHEGATGHLQIEGSLHKVEIFKPTDVQLLEKEKAKNLAEVIYAIVMFPFILISIVYTGFEMASIQRTWGRTGIMSLGWGISSLGFAVGAGGGYLLQKRAKGSLAELFRRNQNLCGGVALLTAFLLGYGIYGIHASWRYATIREHKRSKMLKKFTQWVS